MILAHHIYARIFYTQGYFIRLLLERHSRAEESLTMQYYDSFAVAIIDNDTIVGHVS